MTTYYVSPDGDDDNTGTSDEQPFRGFTRAANELAPGDRLLVMRGVYRRVWLQGIGAEGGPPIIIQPYPGHTVTIDGARLDFLQRPGDAWIPVPPATDPVVVSSALAGGLGTTPFVVNEYVSRISLPPGTDCGAFVSGRPSYTRLITYDQLRDLRAVNQGFGPLSADSDFPGPMIKDWKTSPFPRRPWVYMGPGLWQDASGFLHIRLSPTTHGVPGIEDYGGPTDPRDIPLAIWRHTREADYPTVWIRDCHSVYVNNLAIRHGGGSTVRITRSTDVRLDHLSIHCGRVGIEITEGSRQTRITNTEIDGGMPPWYFRSDRKDGYDLANGDHNSLGEKTVNQPLTCHIGTNDTSIEHCEFVNSHDLQLSGSNVTFSRNWIRNLNDDGIFVGKTARDVRILNNVIEQCLMALSVPNNSAEGKVYVHRNLIDLRHPTAGRRPHPDPTVEIEVLRHGQLFKRHGKHPTSDPEVNVSHNTVLVVDQEIVSSYNLFREYDGTAVRRVYNNIFVAINNSEASDKPIAYLPQVGDHAETNGNCYFRIGRHSPPLLGVRNMPLTFDSIGDLQSSDFFLQSAAEHPPGFEANGTDENPRLRRYWLPLETIPTPDDLRLAIGSPAHNGGVSLDGILPGFGDAPLNGQRPDIGCYPYGSAPLEVGVDGRRRFPKSDLPDPIVAKRTRTAMKVAAAGKGFYKRGDAEEFTGEVWLRNERLAEDGTRMAAVHFSVGARTRWHVHPAGQLLIVLSGRGRVVPRGGKGEMLVPGDIVYTPPGEEHYHGAGPESPMVHVALTIGGSATKWGLPVTDEEYGKDL